MIRKKPKSLIVRMYDGLVCAGADLSDEADHHGIIGNYFVLAFSFFVYFMIGVLLVYWYRLFDVDRAAYESGLGIFTPPIAMLLVVLHGYFVLRKFSRIRFEILVLIVVAIGVLGIFQIALLLGPKTYFFSYLFIVIPIPFLVYGTEHKGFLLTALCMPVAGLTTYILMLVNGLEAHFPIPEIFSTEIRIIVLAALAVNFLLIGFIFWRENHRLQAALKESNAELKEKDGMLQLELDFAADIQQGLMPPVEHRWQNVTLLSNLQPMHKVSGDFYDYYEFDDELYVLLADVSGHGVPAALVTMLAKQCFSARITPGKSPATIFSEVNEDMCRLLTTSDYLTAFMVRITKDEVEYCNAGHIPGVFLEAEVHDTFPPIDTPGLFLGTLEEAGDSYKAHSRRVSKGDQILLLTDGITEAKSFDEDEYTMKSLTAVLERVKKHHTPEEIFAAVIQDWRKFTAHATLRDDVTLLSITFS